MITETRAGVPVLLWFDCCHAARAVGLVDEPRRLFRVVEEASLLHASAAIARCRPRVLACEFDYPDRTQLRLMQVVRRGHPGLPVIMITAHHSEPLAVWALRNRLWNYYVHPVNPEEFRHDLAELLRIVRTDDRSHAPFWPAQDLPPDLPVQRRRDQYTALKPALAYIKQRFRERVREVDVAELCGMSRFEFSRAFHKAFGLTYIDYVLKLRVREARRLLGAPESRVTDVSAAVGFNDPSYFSRVFRQHVGVAPAAWAKVEAERRGDATRLPELADTIITRALAGPIAP
jgi:AraC-like DNA-binding protein